MKTQGDDLAILSARATLLALCGTQLLVGDTRLTSFRLGVDSSTFNADEMIRALSLLSKPLKCSAQVTEKTATLFCEPILDPWQDVTYQYWVKSGVERLIASILRRYEADVSDSLVVLRSGAESLVFSISVLRRWLLDFMLGGIALGLRPPDAAAIQSGGMCIIHAAPTYGEHLTTLRIG
jgi:hypothetical protein